MTTEELRDLRSIAAAVQGIADQQREDQVWKQQMGDRMSKVERFVDRVDGALTLAKVALSFVGLGGVALFIAAISKGS